MAAVTHGSPRPIIGVHLDLKGMNFKPSYIPQYLADLAGQGVNAVLVEYEDTFPFRPVPGFGSLEIAHDRAVVWSPRTVRRFQAEAAQNGIETIPLQQCLGHLEYLLGWTRFRDLAEKREYPSTIRVDDRRAVALIEAMLRQVIEAHPASRFVHVGMDEAHALYDAAKRLGRDVLDLFLARLRRLLALVEPYGKQPIVWTDMLEGHFRPGAFDEFRGRVVFATWDYGVARDPRAGIRLGGGVRVSREWLNEPENPAAPPIGVNTRFVEDLPPRLRRMLAPYRQGRMYRPLFQIDLWTKEGVQVLPVGALRVSEDLSVLPFYNDRRSNLAGWAKAVRRTRQMGLIGTSWARGTSWCPPNYCIDLSWPLVADLGRVMGAKPKPFWPGIPARTADRIIRTLGRCRMDWRLETDIADEMDALAPRLRAHRYEWNSIALMARVLALQRRAEFNILEVDCFHANIRPADTEWRRRLRDQRKTLRDLAALRRTISAHFGQRYHGEAFREWVRALFDLYVARLKEARKNCRRKLKLARQAYGGRKA